MARPQKALVVDDLAVNRLILGTILTKLGFEVLEAENGLQCIDVFSQERTQLVCIFLDLQMPIADGWAATKGIRELESQISGGEYIRVPVVVCTASCLDDLVDDGQTVAQRALSLGADGAVRKPLTTNAVRRILDEYAPRWRNSSEPLADLSISTPPPRIPPLPFPVPGPAVAFAPPPSWPSTNTSTSVPRGSGPRAATAPLAAQSGQPPCCNPAFGPSATATVSPCSQAEAASPRTSAQRQCGGWSLAPVPLLLRLPGRDHLAAMQRCNNPLGPQSSCLNDFLEDPHDFSGLSPDLASQACASLQPCPGSCQGSLSPQVSSPFEGPAKAPSHWTASAVGSAGAAAAVQPTAFSSGGDGACWTCPTVRCSPQAWGGRSSCREQGRGPWVEGGSEAAVLQPQRRMSYDMSQTWMAVGAGVGMGLGMARTASPPALETQRVSVSVSVAIAAAAQ